MPVLYNYLSPENLPSRRTSTSSLSFRNSPSSLARSLVCSRACSTSLPAAELCLQTFHHLHSSLPRPIRVMASSSVMRTALVVMAVVSSVAVLANAQIPSPAPTPGAGFSLAPSIVAPVLGMVVAFFASRVLC